jgi:hypothetical protein
LSSHRRAVISLLTVMAFVLGSCSGQIAASPAVVRPSSPAVISIVQPASGATVSGTTVHVALSLTGAKIVSQTTTNIRPDEGHVHLFVDNVLVSMNYGLEQDLPVHPGTYVLTAEFVAADHAPFNPRVVSGQTIFTVREVARRHIVGIGALACGLAIIAGARAARPVAAPLFDGVVVVEPYRYFDPPPGAAGSPASASAILTIDAGKSPGFAVYTSDTPPQAELLAQGGELSIGSGTTAVKVTIEPVPSPQGPSPEAIAGNVYRFVVTDQSGAALSLLPGQSITLALRGPAGVAPDAAIARFDGGAWRRLATEPSGLQDLFITNADAFGDLALLGRVTASPTGLDPEFLLFALAAAGLTLLFGWRFGGTSNPLAPSGSTGPARRGQPRNRHDKPLKALTEVP